MRKINSPGNVSNLFVDYDPVNNPLGTVYSADWGNDVQTDLIEIQEFAGLPEAAGSQANVLKSIIKIAKEQAKELGEVFSLDTLQLPAEFDPTDTDTAQEYFPSICLSSINIQTTIDVANWPLLVPHLREKQIKYLEGLGGEVASFACSVAGSVVTLTNTTENNRLLVALAKWVLVHGSYTNWVTVTVGGVDFAITNINTTTRAITVTGSPDAGATTCTFFPHRVPADTDTARVYAHTGKSIISPNDADGLFIPGIMMMGHFQDHQHAYASGGQAASISGETNDLNAAGATGGPDVASGTHAALTSESYKGAVAGTYSTNIRALNGIPRATSETHSPSGVYHLYLFGRIYQV